MNHTFPMPGGDEVYLLTRDVEPPTLHLDCRFSGELDESRLREAARFAVRAHPILRATLASRRRGFRPPRWEIDPDRPLREVVETERCETEADVSRLRDALYSRPVALDEAPALRLVLARRPGGDSLFLRFHHAQSDGVGTLRILRSIARAYGGLPEPDPPFDPIAARDPCSEVWPRRSTTRPPGVSSRLNLPRGSVTLIAPEGTPGAPGYGFALARLPHDRRRLLDPQRHGSDVTLNDLIMAALHLTIDAWNTRKKCGSDCVAVFLPVNNRPAEHAAEFVGNFTAGGRVVSLADQRADLPTLVRLVADRRKALQEGSGFASIQATPVWLQRLLPLVVYGVDRPMVASGLSRLLGDLRMSAVLSALGRLDDLLRDFGPDPGPCREIWVSGPVQSPPGLTMGTALLNRDLFLTFRYRCAQFDHPAAERFADLFLEQLERLGR